MSITGGLLAFGVRYVFNISADHVVNVIEKRMADHSHALPKALSRANDRAWTAVGLALNGDSLFDRVKDIFRDADMKGVRDQIKNFLDHTPTGLEDATATIRAKAAEEWTRLRKAGRFVAAPVSAGELARRAATMERHGDPARITAAAHHAVKETAEALRDEAPVLADLLTAAPDGGTPLLAAAFAFFFRREVEANTELAHGLSFDYLKLISERQERGLDVLDFRTAGILDQINVLFDALEKWFAAQDAKLDKIIHDLDKLIRQRDVPTSTSEPLKVSVTDKDELKLLQKLRDQLRDLPPELVASADWSKLGDTLAAAGLFQEAMEAHKAAVAAAKEMADRQAEAEAEYKRFRDACETGDRDAAMTAFRRAVELHPDRYTPFDLNRYLPQAVLGVGGFGTVFLAYDEYDPLPDGPRKVAIKAVHDSGWDAVLERDLAETFKEASVLSTLNHPGIIKTLNRGFGDPVKRKRPFMVLEYFEGVTLDTLLRAKGPLPVKDALVIAKQMAEAVHAAHGCGIYHRDIKPANVMVRFDEKAQRWVVKVIDFGLAVKLHVARSSMSVPSGRRAALDRSLAGTLRYCPPEQRNELDADPGPYSDVYAWGKTCLDLLFGTTEPKLLHWKKLPDEYRDRVQELFEQATVDDLAFRFADFEPVVSSLAGLLGEWRYAGPTTGETLKDVAAAVENLMDNPPTVRGLDGRSTARRTPTPKPTIVAADTDIPFAEPIEEPPEPPLQPGEVRLVVNDHYNITRNLNPWLTEDVCRSSVLTVECVGMAGNPSFRFVPFDKGPAYGMKLAGDADRAAWGRITAAANDSNRVSLRVKFKVAPLKRGPETPIDFFIRVTGEITALGNEARALAGPDHGYDYAAAVEKLSHLTDEQARVWAENPLPEKELLRDLTDKRDRLSDLRKKIDPLYHKLKYNDPRLAVWVPQLLELDPSDEQMRKLQGRLPPPNEPPANPKPGDFFTLRIVPPDEEHRAGRILSLTIPSPKESELRAGGILTVPIPPPREGELRAGCVTTLKWKPVPPRANPNK